MSRDFRLLWWARAVSDTGDWLLMIALPLHVFALTGSTLATSGIFLAELLPALLLGSVAGVLVDRWDRRRTLAAAGAAQALLLLPLLLVDDPGWVWLVLVVATVQSTLARLSLPAVFALVPSVVPAEELPRANTFLGVADAVARLGGAPLGGLLYAVGGLSTVVAVDAATFLASAALAYALRPAAGRPGPAGRSADDAEPAAAAVPAAVAPPAAVAVIGTAVGPPDPTVAAPDAAGGHPAADAQATDAQAGGGQAGGGQSTVASPGLVAGWTDGMRTILRSRRLSTVIGATALAQLAQGIFLVLFLVWVQRSLHGDGTAVGLLRGVQAVGAVVGGVALGLLARRLRPEAMFGYSLVVLGLLTAVQWNLAGATTWLGWYVVLFILSGFPAVALQAGVLTIAQSAVPPSHLGRVAGTFDSVAAVANGAGVLLAGLLGDRLPLTALLDGQAAALLLAGLLALAVLGWRIRA